MDKNTKEHFKSTTVLSRVQLNNSKYFDSYIAPSMQFNHVAETVCDFVPMRALKTVFSGQQSLSIDSAEIYYLTRSIRYDQLDIETISNGTIGGLRVVHRNRKAAGVAVDINTLNNIHANTINFVNSYKEGEHIAVDNNKIFCLINNKVDTIIGGKLVYFYRLEEAFECTKCGCIFGNSADEEEINNHTESLQCFVDHMLPKMESVGIDTAMHMHGAHDGSGFDLNMKNMLLASSLFTIGVNNCQYVSKTTSDLVHTAVNTLPGVHMYDAVKSLTDVSLIDDLTKCTICGEPVNGDNIAHVRATIGGYILCPKHSSKLYDYMKAMKDDNVLHE